MGSYTLFGMLLGGILSGTLSDLYGRKVLFVSCLSLFAACMVVTAWAPTPTWFGASRFVAGLGLGGIIPVAGGAYRRVFADAPEEPELRHHVFRIFRRDSGCGARCKGAVARPWLAPGGLDWCCSGCSGAVDVVAAAGFRWSRLSRARAAQMGARELAAAAEPSSTDGKAESREG